LKQKTSKYATYFLILFYSVGALGFAILYIKNTFDCSRITANNYSTSFSFGIKMFKKITGRAFTAYPALWDLPIKLLTLFIITTRKNW